MPTFLESGKPSDVSAENPKVEEYLNFLDEYWELFELTYRDPRPETYEDNRL